MLEHKVRQIGVLSPKQRTEHNTQLKDIPRKLRAVPGEPLATLSRSLPHPCQIHYRNCLYETPCITARETIDTVVEAPQVIRPSQESAASLKDNGEKYVLYTHCHRSATTHDIIRGDVMAAKVLPSRPRNPTTWCRGE